ncbi:HAMP domain-containing histidine kinase [Vibrio natriegens]|uniref:sensor histidine kinase n=1 Tax=Vibrio natriegens TaxID=691 RepID=UPI001EFD33F3|nr:HAMP domain-containing sensor histidine kinase [Vibrio natriegens]MCG9699427.1 HAMP domain-containing histidine kinase [Vibrio natriegens]
MRLTSQYFQKRLYNRVFALIMGLVLLLTLSLLLMAWINAQLHTDSLVNQKLNQQMRFLLDDSIKKGRLVKVNSPMFSSFVGSDKGLPLYLSGLTEQGVFEIEHPKVHVQVVSSPFSDGLLYLLYFPEKDLERSLYQNRLKYYVVIGVMALMGIGLIASLYITRIIVKPITTLQKSIECASPDSPPAVLDRQDELGQLSRSFTNAFQRIRAFVEREHNFTRFASHELRTPVTIIQGALEVIAYSPDLAKAQPALSRIESANKDMQALIHTFLSISRESKTEQVELLSLQESLDYCLQQLSTDKADILSVQYSLNSKSVNKILAHVVIQNVLRNAFSYSANSVAIELKYDRLVVSNDIDPDCHSGYGHGIDIINAICEKADWLAFYRCHNNRFSWLIYF